MRQVHYLRHGETPFNAENRWCGSGSDPELSECGVAQITLVGQKALALGLDIELIIASPLKRTRQSAEIMSDFLARPVIIRHGLRERYFGDLEGQVHTPEVNKAYEASESALDIYGAETLEELQARADGMRDELSALPFKSGLIVGHGSFGRALYRSIHELPITDRSCIMPNAEIISYTI